MGEARTHPAKMDGRESRKTEKRNSGQRRRGDRPVQTGDVSKYVQSTCLAAVGDDGEESVGTGIQVTRQGESAQYRKREPLSSTVGAEACRTDCGDPAARIVRI